MDKSELMYLYAPKPLKIYRIRVTWFDTGIMSCVGENCAFPHHFELWVERCQCMNGNTQGARDNFGCKRGSKKWYSTLVSAQLLAS